jgi:hypothetical protein
VNVSADCRDVSVIGTTGVATNGLVNYGTGATGERGLNKNSTAPLVAPTTNANYFCKLEAFADASLSMQWTVAFGNEIGRYSVTGDTFQIGRGGASSANILAGSNWGLNQSPDASAALAVNSTAKGFLPPRMTKAQRNAISSPSNGLCVYQTDSTPGYRFYENGAWTKPTTTADP